MKQMLSMVLAFGCMVASPLRAHSCFCITPELSESFKQSRAVFLGEVLDIVKPKTSSNDAPLVDRAFTIKFKILQTWKGPFSAAELNILWLTNCYECLDLPQPKNRYLVFADPVSGSATWGIVASCNRTEVVDDDSKIRLMNPDAIDRYRDLKQLDIMTRQSFTLEPPRFRRRV